MNKYRNKKTERYGHKFDSMAEADYYLIAKRYAEKNSLEMRMQEKFEIEAKFKFNGKGYRAITYKPDYTFYEDGKLVKVVDVKGMQTKDFKLKAKLFVARYRIPLILAKKTRNGFIEEEF